MERLIDIGSPPHDSLGDLHYMRCNTLHSILDCMKGWFDDNVWDVKLYINFKLKQPFLIVCAPIRILVVQKL